MAISLQTQGDRTYLAGIRPMAWADGEMCEFAGALTRVLECVGENVAYHYVMGVTGVAFRFTFGPEAWNPGFYGFAGVTADVHDLFRRAFAAVGRDYCWHARGDEAEDRRRLLASLDRGVAVMLRGHVVDASDWALITGYEAGGAVLLGSSPYGGAERFAGYDVMRDWHAQTEGYIILGDPRPRPAATAVYTEALRLAVELVRTPEIGGHFAGLRAYAALAAVLREPTFTAEIEGDANAVWFRYLCLLCYLMMLDDHASAPPFLREAAEALPAGAANLEQAAQCYERSCELRQELEDVLPSNFSPEAQQRVLDPAVREAFAGTLLRIRDTEEEGVAHLERALAALGGGGA